MARDKQCPYFTVYKRPCVPKKKDGYKNCQRIFRIRFPSFLCEAPPEPRHERANQYGIPQRDEEIELARFAKGIESGKVIIKPQVEIFEWRTCLLGEKNAKQRDNPKKKNNFVFPIEPKPEKSEKRNQEKIKRYRLNFEN